MVRIQDTSKTGVRLAHTLRIFEAPVCPFEHSWLNASEEREARIY